MTGMWEWRQDMEQQNKYHGSRWRCQRVYQTAPLQSPLFTNLLALMCPSTQFSPFPIHLPLVVSLMSQFFIPLICRQVSNLSLQSRSFSLTPGLKYPTANSVSHFGCLRSFSSMNKTKLPIFTQSCQTRPTVLLSVVTGRVIPPLPKPKSLSWFLTPCFLTHLISKSICRSFQLCIQNITRIQSPLLIPFSSPSLTWTLQQLPNPHFSAIPPPATRNLSHLVKVILLKYNHFLIHHSVMASHFTPIQAQDYKVLLALILCLF